MQLLANNRIICAMSTPHSLTEATFVNNNNNNNN